ncbi:hypothetical protein DXG03_000528 [Asterophora parasitica]|uniref:Uncharacterized protein n=1 Tax=Asterophora parasitica TaxID=117018 RepID=A0A9P7FX65_9AGAR|nr:hypothetical protein DXG03_000528 [Asterophora parasitica]
MFTILHSGDNSLQASLERTLDEDDSHLRLPADNSLSTAECSSLPPQFSIHLTTPERDLTPSESDSSLTALSSQASTSQTGVAIPNGRDIEVEDHHSIENLSLSSPSLLSQTQVSPALAANSSPSRVVPEKWKRETTLTVTESIVPKTFLAILKECPNLHTLSVNISPPIASQELDEEVDVLDIMRVENLEMLSIMTSVEPYAIFQYLRLPNLNSLSLAWDRSSGQDLLARPDGLKIDKLLEESFDFYSLSLSNIFPPKEELLAILKSHGEKLEEIIVRADPTPGLLAMSLERLVTGKTLLALAHSGRLKSLDLSYASPEVVPAAEVSGLSATISSRELSAPAPWQLAISFAKIMDQEEIDREAEKLL